MCLQTQLGLSRWTHNQLFSHPNSTGRTHQWLKSLLPHSGHSCVTLRVEAILTVEDTQGSCLLSEE